MSYGYDEPPRELPPGAVGVCDECAGPAEELQDGLCERCRCVDCGATDAPVEHDDARLCRHCATDRGVVRPAVQAWEAA